jgi:hypothetical protein
MAKKATSDNVVRRQGSIATIREQDKLGRPTGHAFHRCTLCGEEVMTGWGRSGISHDDNCPNATEGDR